MGNIPTEDFAAILLTRVKGTPFEKQISDAIAADTQRKDGHDGHLAKLHLILSQTQAEYQQLTNPKDNSKVQVTKPQRDRRFLFGHKPAKFAYWEALPEVGDLEAALVLSGIQPQLNRPDLNEALAESNSAITDLYFALKRARGRRISPNPSLQEHLTVARQAECNLDEYFDASAKANFTYHHDPHFKKIQSPTAEFRLTDAGAKAFKFMVQTQKETDAPVTKGDVLKKVGRLKSKFPNLFSKAFKEEFLENKGKQDRQVWVKVPLDRFQEIA